MSRKTSLNPRFISFGVNLILINALGCGSSGESTGPPGAPETKGPARDFEKTHGSTNTPFGQPVPGTVKDVGGGKIEFKTSGGSTIRTTPEKVPGGPVQYSGTEVVK